MSDTSIPQTIPLAVCELQGAAGVFRIELVACGDGYAARLLQDGKLIADPSRGLKPKDATKEWVRDIVSALLQGDKPAIGAVVAKTSLYFTEGGSDKEYHAQVVAKDGGYTVDFQYGRRGGTLQTGSKTPAPVAADKALAVFASLVFEKSGKGYTPAESGAVFQDTANAGRTTGMLPMLLNAIERTDAAKYINDPAWVGQQKYDGERRGLKRAENEVTGSNRQGLAVPLPMGIVNAALSLPIDDFTIDAEIIGNKLFVVDVVEIGGEDIRSRSLDDRLLMLAGLFATHDGGPHTNAMVMAYTARTSEEKAKLLAMAEQLGQEGVVFKRRSAPYVPGRPSAGGDQLKLKFVESATVEVSVINAGKRSVETHVYDTSGKPVPNGSVTIPPNHAVPTVGQIVEVNYLYAYQGGSLFQPTYKGVRTDQTIADCGVGQLKFKQAHQDLAPDDAQGAPASRRLKP